MSSDPDSCAVKFCGGCHPCYDRLAAYFQLIAQLDGQPTMAQPRQNYNIIYVFHGCTSRCTHLSDLTAKKIVEFSSDDDVKTYLAYCQT